MKYFIAMGIVLALLFAGCIGTGAQAPQQSAEDKANEASKKAMEEKAMAEKKAMEEKAAMEAKAMAEKKAMEEKQAMMDKNKSNESAMEKKETEGAMMDKGKASYSPYDAEAYQKAKSEGKIIYLEFYAPWCPYCREYEPKLLAAFDAMGKDARYKDVVGFKVDYDTQNDLKQEFGIVGQHTHVIIGRDGSVVVKSREIWSSEDLIANIGKAL